MGPILAYSEKSELTCELAAEARRFQEQRGGDPDAVAAALFGDAAELATELFYHGAKKIYVTQHEALAGCRPEAVAPALAQIAERCGADTLFLDSTRRGKDLAPRVAELLGAGCVTDAVGVRWEAGEWRADRSALGGNTVATDAIKTERAVIAVMPRVFERGPREPRSGQVIPVDVDVQPSPARLVETRAKNVEGGGLNEAEIVFGVGRGFKKKEDLALVQELAEVLNAEVGCSRTLATDYEWLAEDRMIGLSGKRIAPRLYLALGISGQIQHTVGITGAKLIAAINTDKEAPIFKLTDYGLIGDLYEVLPEITRRLRGERLNV